MRPTVRKTAAQTAVAKAKVMSPHQRQEFWRSQGIDPKKVKTHTDGIRGPVTLKMFHMGQWPVGLAMRREDMCGKDGR